MNSASYRTYRLSRGLIQMRDRKGSFCSYDEVSPLDETALARQFEFSALRRLRTTQLRPMMTGPTKTQDRRGMKLQQLTFIHHRDREFSRSPEGARTPRGQVGPRSTLARRAAGQTLYRLMRNRLGTLQVVWSTNPGSEGLTDHSTRWLMLHHSRT